MKKISISLLIVLFVLLMSSLQAATNHNETVSTLNVWGNVVYTGSIAIDDTTTGDIYYTQAMNIGCVDKSRYGWIYGVCAEAGTEDLNLFLEYSADLVTWVAGSTDTDIDAVGTTAKIDTIGIVATVACQKYAAYSWVRLKIVPGQAVDKTTFTWKIWFPKLPDLVKDNVAIKTNYPTS